MEESLSIGGVQDADWSHQSLVLLEGSRWSEPQRDGEVYFRRLTATPASAIAATGPALFNLFAFQVDEPYALKIRYRARNAAQPTLSVHHNCRALIDTLALPGQEPGWQETRVRLPSGGAPGEGPSLAAAESPSPRTGRVSRWAGEGSLLIDKVALLAADGSEQTVFTAGSRLTLQMTVRACRSGAFHLLPTATLYRLDGILVSNFIGEASPLTLAEGQTQELQLDLDPLLLGNAYYVFSVAIYEKVVAGNTIYDLLNRSYEFSVVGNEPDHAWFVFRHPSSWKGPSKPDAQAREGASSLACASGLDLACASGFDGFRARAV